VLTTEQLTELFFHSATRGKTRLVTLYRLGLLDRFQPWRPGGGSWSYHYVLGR